jgi:serine/threonine protein kinase
MEKPIKKQYSEHMTWDDAWIGNYLHGSVDDIRVDSVRRHDDGVILYKITLSWGSEELTYFKRYSEFSFLSSSMCGADKEMGCKIQLPSKDYFSYIREPNQNRVMTRRAKLNEWLLERAEMAMSSTARERLLNGLRALGLKCHSLHIMREQLFDFFRLDGKQVVDSRALELSLESQPNNISVDAEQATLVKQNEEKEGLMGTSDEKQVVAGAFSLTDAAKSRSLKELTVVEVDSPVEDKVRQICSFMNPLAKSATAEVWRVRSRSSGGLFACKIVRAGQSLADQSCLRAQLAVLQHTHHENLARALHVFSSPAELCLLLDLAPAGDLSTFLTRRRRGLCEERAQFVFRQLLEATAYLHACGARHGCIEPAHILLFPHDGEEGGKERDEFFDVKLTSFGSAASLPLPAAVNESTESDAVSVGLVLRSEGIDQGLGHSSSVGYRAPEVAASRMAGTVPPPPSDSADMWALGCVLFELLTARRAFCEYRYSSAELLAKILRADLDVESSDARVNGPSNERQGRSSTIFNYGKTQGRSDSDSHGSSLNHHSESHSRSSSICSTDGARRLSRAESRQSSGERKHSRHRRRASAYSSLGAGAVDMLHALIVVKPRRRMSAQAALSHEWLGGVNKR